jgi:hypothetical protein
MTKIRTGSTTQAINQLAAQAPPYQWLRELIVNGLESGAEQITIDPVNKELYQAYGAYKIVISDNGSGMTRDELVTYMSQIFNSGKSMGGVTDNMGIGARVTTLDWNSYGVVVLSVKNGESSMVWMHKNANNDYEIRDFWDDDEDMEVAAREPDEYDIDGVTVDWDKVIPNFIKMSGHGTSVVLLGDEKHQETRLGQLRLNGEGWRMVDGEKKYANMPEWNYLQRRFWTIGPVQIGDYKWDPVHPEWNASIINALGYKESWNQHDRHPVYGALTNIFQPQGIGKNKRPSVTWGVVDLPDAELPARVHWFLRAEPLPASLFSYWKKPALGYTAALYRDELYDHSERRFRHFGVGYSEVAQRCFFIVEPVTADGSLTEAKGSIGVRPNNVRSRLLWGDNDKDLPWEEWSRLFRAQLPEPIADAVKEYEKNLPTTEDLDPETYARIANYLDTTFPVERIRRRKDSDEKFGEQEGRGTGSSSDTENQDKKPKVGAETGKTKGKSDEKTKKTGDGDDSAGSLSHKPGDQPGQRYKGVGSLPRIQWLPVATLTDEDQEEAPFYAVMYTPASAAEPRGLITIAEHFEDIKAVKDRLAEEFEHNPAVTETVLRNAYTGVVGANVLVQVATLLRRRKSYSADLRSRLFDPVNLTQSVVGLESEYREIRNNLSRQFTLGKKKAAA